MTHTPTGLQTSTESDRVVVGFDTHRDTHHGAVVDERGRLLRDKEFTADQAGYQAVWDWLCDQGEILAVGIEGTGSYGAGLARMLTERGLTVREVNRPDRGRRRRQGKTDRLDAESAARAALSGQTTATAKTGTGAVESLRALQRTRAMLVRHKTAAINHLRALLVTCPEPALRDRLRALTTPQLITTCAALDEPDDLTDPTAATRASLRMLGLQLQQLKQATTTLHNQISTLVSQLAPATLSLYGLGPDTVAQLLITCGDNPDRLHSEASLAALTGTCPLPASSGRTHRHRLNRGGDRRANKALHQAVITRMRRHPETQAYVHKRTQDGLTHKDITRCLKRYLVRQIYKTIRHDFAQLTP